MAIINKLDAIGDAIREKTGKTGKLQLSEMPDEIRSISGGSLNFNVIGSTVQPAGVENLVWVNTSDTITSWVVSPNQPENASEGMVWIQDGTDNVINILNENTVEVFPSACKQYIGSMWQNVDAHLFRNGKWVQFSFSKLYIVQNGVEQTGLELTRHVRTNAQTSKTSENGLLRITTLSNTDYVLTPQRKIDLTKYSKYSIEGYDPNVTNFNRGIIATMRDGETTTQAGLFDLIISSVNVFRGESVNITQIDLNLSGEYYLGVGMLTVDSANKNLFIKNLWLE